MPIWIFYFLFLLILCVPSLKSLAVLYLTPKNKFVTWIQPCYIYKIFFQILYFIFLKKKKKKIFTLWDFHSFMYPTKKPKVRNIKGRFIERESNWNSGFNLYPWEGSDHIGEIRNGIKEENKLRLMLQDRIYLYLPCLTPLFTC